jgi:hypothetical protein
MGSRVRELSLGAHVQICRTDKRETLVRLRALAKLRREPGRADAQQACGLSAGFPLRAEQRTDMGKSVDMASAHHVTPLGR